MALDRQSLQRRWAPTLNRTVEVITEPVPEPVPAPLAQAEPAASSTSGTPSSATSLLEPARAFVADVDGKTLLNAPASLFTNPQWSASLSPNPGMLWMQGRFVGAEEPNRNGALWSTSDLELGQATVAHGPLNWLHESRHIIGTIADARLVRPGQGSALVDPDQVDEPRVQAEESPNPHIVAASAIWKWIYPDEAYVIEQADDAGYLWYSMECISSDVECAGEGGCGRVLSYAKYIQNMGCVHMRERSSVRRFINPTFLGGAVIVPPSRPGWADADARLLPEAASLAEKAYEQAGTPDIPTSTWEQIVNQVVHYAKG